MEDNMTRVRLYDILKGLCICLVIITHFPLADSVRGTVYYHYLIEMAVPFFMMISGYLHAASMERRGIDSFEKAYSCKQVLPQLLKYTIPYGIVFAVFTGYCISQNYYMSVSTKLIEFVTGSMGPGGYYYPILIQMIFIFPVVYFILKKNPEKGLVTLLMMNAVYEFLQRTYDIYEPLYRLLIFRYLFAIAAGACVRMTQREWQKRWLLLMFLVGAAFIALVCYTGYQPKILRYWTSTSFPVIFYCLPLFWLMVKYGSGLKCGLIEIMGKASWHIFLVQAIYYGAFMGWAVQLQGNEICLFALSLVGCVLAGILFYFLESPVTKKINEGIGKLLM